jgi:predicted AAA+ superfamily ATPase
MIRLDYITKITAALETFPVVALLGPRQVGKTTLARDIFAAKSTNEERELNYFDLENPSQLARLQDPMLGLQELKGLVIIDEIQRRPELFPILRVLVDRPKNPAKFLILGSASQELLKQTSETLAGRIKYINIHPFGLSETGPSGMDALWLRGGYPLAYLAKDDPTSFEWLEQYARTFLERDIPQLGFNFPAESMRRFWMMLAHYHGQLVNFAEIARSMDISESTAKRYFDILVGTFMVRRLQPWHVNIDKRQIKTPKIYFMDSGIYHLLASIFAKTSLQTSPKLGASWEGFALEQVIRFFDARAEDNYFWGVHQQCEIDLLVRDKGTFRAFEVKHTLAPKVSSSMITAMKLLKLEELTIVYPGTVEIPLTKNITAKPLNAFVKL